MTASIPNSFSSDDLQRLLENAPSEDVKPSGDGPHGEQGLTEEEVLQLASDRLDCTDKCNDPIVHKVMIHMIVMNMIEWHSKMGAKLVDEGQEGAAMAWFRDAGKWQAVANILDTINVSGDDFTCSHMNDN